MDGMLWGPGAEAALAYRRERIDGTRRAAARRAAGRTGGHARHRRARRAERPGRHARVAAPGADPARGWVLPGSGAWPAA